MTTYQLAVLLAYNNTLEYSYTALAQLTGLREGDLSVTLQSLVDAKLVTMDTEVWVGVVYECYCAYNVQVCFVCGVWVCS